MTSLATTSKTSSGPCIASAGAPALRYLGVAFMGNIASERPQKTKSTNMAAGGAYPLMSKLMSCIANGPCSIVSNSPFTVIKPGGEERMLHRSIVRKNGKVVGYEKKRIDEGRRKKKERGKKKKRKEDKSPIDKKRTKISGWGDGTMWSSIRRLVIEDKAWLLSTRQINISYGNIFPSSGPARERTKLTTILHDSSDYPPANLATNLISYREVFEVLTQMIVWNQIPSRTARDEE
jgi:hypothetical protein